MMDLRTTVDRIRCDVLGASCAKAFDARSRCAELSDIESVSELLAIVQNKQAFGLVRRDKLTRAIVTMYRETHERLWSSLLIIVYYPMLSSLSFSVVTKMGRDDIGQVVLTAFISAIDVIQLSRYRNVAFGIQQLTRRLVFEELSRDMKRESAFGSLNKHSEAHILSKRPMKEADMDSDNLIKYNLVNHSANHSADEELLTLIDLSLFFNRACDSGINIESLKLLVDLDGDTMRTYCERNNVNQKGYQRLRKARYRAMNKLQRMAEGLEG